MHTKKEDDFFKEDTDSDQASRDLMKMISKFDPADISELAAGSLVKGTVTKIGTEYVYFDIGSKLEAIMNIKECYDAHNDLTVKIGDSLSGYVVSDPANELIVSKKLTSTSAAQDELYNIHRNKIPVQGKITGVSKDGLSVKLLGKKAFCPISQIDIKYVENVNIYLGKTLDFIISRISEGGKNIILSRIPLLEKVLSVKIDELQQFVESRSIIKGTITKVTDFGLFVDIGGVEGLVHISELSWEHSTDLSEKYSPGQEVEVLILGVVKNSPLRNTKISLSIKQVTENPWQSVEKLFSVGQSIQGKVVRITNFGAFVELLPGVDGLVHISEMSWVKKVNHPSEIVAVGSFVNATILAIDLIKKNISLSLKDISEDPWRDIEKKFPLGSETSGVIIKKSRYGYFVDLCEGVTALLVFSKIAPDKKEALKENDTIQVTIDSIDNVSRRISLSYGITVSNDAGDDIAAFMQVKNAPASNSSTEFGAALMAALKKK
jgi:small subunit ribosomal protein S1